MPSQWIGHNKQLLTLFTGNTLPAAGALSSSSGVITGDFNSAALFLTYVQANATGSMKILVQESPDGGTSWYDQSLENSDVTTLNPYITTTVGSAYKQLMTGSLSTTYYIPIAGNKLRLQAGEVGCLLAPGIISASIVLRK